MGKFKKYQHIERFGTCSTKGIENGKCHIFYKLDGTNASVWLENGELKAGSRKRELTLANDNAGFYAAILKDTKHLAYLKAHPTHRLYGEWLVKHTLKTYRDDAWGKFYVFDICVGIDDNKVKYIPYDTYKPLLKEFDINYIPPLAIIENPSYESLIKLLDKTSQYLIKDGLGYGEGIVIKNYDYYNKYGRQVWGKIISSEFKEKNTRKTGSAGIKDSSLIEEKIVEKFCTSSFIEKEYAKLLNQLNGEWEQRNIPMLLGKVYNEFITEEMWNILKKFKNPTINFKILKCLVDDKVKQVKSNLF